MQLRDALVYVFEQNRPRVEAAVRGLDATALAWRPDPDANSIGWLVWHLTRVEDDHVSELAQRPQVWADGAWAERFGLPAGSTDTGYGHGSEQVAAVAPTGPQALLEYSDRVAEQTAAYLRDRTLEDLDRVVDRSYDPPVTVAVRLLSVAGDALQHLGQAAYVRGLLERRA